MDHINPEHYRNHPSGIECIDVIRSLPFSQGAAIKYLWRLGQKDDVTQEINKAIWFINDCLKTGVGIKLTNDLTQQWYESEPAGYRREAIHSILNKDYKEALRWLTEHSQVNLYVSR